MLRSGYRWLFGSIILLFVVSYFGLSKTSLEPLYRIHSSENPKPASHKIVALLESTLATSQHFMDYPLPSSDFGEMGKRIQVLRSWIEAEEQLSSQMTTNQKSVLASCIEKSSLSLFPFLRNPSRRSNHNPLRQLRQTYIPGSKAIVIPTGKKTFRYACHLIVNLRNVLNSKLPIQIVYADNADLPLEYQDFATSLGSDIETLGVTRVLDDETLQLAQDGWAIKPFALLVSKFEQVMVLDADAVLLQPPEVIFNGHTGYQHSGTLLFHDRLLWQGAFKDRHAWWEKELKHHIPSTALNKSLVFNEGYAEECDSGMVIMDKSRLPTLLGLLHICWQNSFKVRKDWTYRMGYGDKESWWFGLELSGTNYTFESHYGAVLGHVRSKDESETEVCGFTIAHTDEQNKLLWYNGSLLKNKAVNDTIFDVPKVWMVDGIWEKGATKPDMSCMRASAIRQVDTIEMEVIENSVNNAKAIDQQLKLL